MYLKTLLFKTLLRRWWHVPQLQRRRAAWAEDQGLAGLPGASPAPPALGWAAELRDWGAKPNAGRVASTQFVSFGGGVIWPLRDQLSSFFREIYIAWLFLSPAAVDFCSASPFSQCLLQLHSSVGIHTQPPQFITTTHTVLLIFKTKTKRY